jgi:hypothetical protein
MKFIESGKDAVPNKGAKGWTNAIPSAKACYCNDGTEESDVQIVIFVRAAMERRGMLKKASAGSDRLYT